MGSSSGTPREDANPNGDWTDDRFLSLTLGVFGRFVDLDLFETDDIYRRKADLEILVSKLYDMTDVN